MKRNRYVSQKKPTTAERHNGGEAEISSMILSNGAPAPFDNRA
jgi:hypothetical protein